MRDGWMVGNPCLQATRPKVETDEIEPASLAWVRSLIAAAESVNPDFAVCLRLAAAPALGAASWSPSRGPTSVAYG